MKRHTRQQPKGVVSLLALMLMTTLTAAALAASTIILAELRQTETFDQSVVAVYAAEAGMEDALHIVKLNRQSATGSFSSTVSGLNCVPPAPCSSAEDARRAMTNGSFWTRTAEEDEQFHVVHLEPEQTAHLDLFNPDVPTGASGAAALFIDWTDSCQGYNDDHGYSTLEVTMLSWADLTFNPATQQVFKHTQVCTYAERSPGISRCTPFELTAVDGVTIDPLKFYRFNFRVLPQGPFNPYVNSVPVRGCTIQDLIVTAYRDAAMTTIVPTPARMTVKTTGAFANSHQALTASVPWRAPVSGLLNYVLFSGDPLNVVK